MDKIKVLIFGVNGYGLKVKYLLDDENYEVIGFIDNQKAIQNTNVFMECSCGGVMVYSPEDICRINFDYIIIAINRHEKDMKKQLIELYGEKILDKIITFEAYEKDIIWLEERHAMLRRCADEIYRRKISGNVAELGVYQGEFAKYINRFFHDRKIYLFDTFEGFDDRDKLKIKEVGIEIQNFTFKDTSLNLVLNKMKYPENVIIKKGYFPESVQGIEDKFCFVSIDADLYTPILNGLEYFYPRLEKGGYIFIHDFGGYSFEGAKQAVLEFCDKYNISYVPLLDNCLSVVITK